jgi:hypothetical protein
MYFINLQFSQPAVAVNAALAHPEPERQALRAGDEGR